MNAFNTTFKHRIPAGSDGNFYNPIDAINPSLKRAGAIADLIEVVCNVASSDSFEHDTLWHAAQAIRLEIKDAQVLLYAYFEAEKASKAEKSSIRLV